MTPQEKLDFAKMSDKDFRATSRRLAKTAKKFRDKYNRSRDVSLRDKKAADEADANLVAFVGEETPEPKEPDDD